jgi:hypothetical protein
LIGEQIGLRERTGTPRGPPERGEE